MKNDMRFIKELISLRLSRIMTFRLGFFGPFFIDTSFFLIQILAFEAIYGHVDSVGGWSRGEILIFVGTFTLIDALNMIVYFFGVISIPEKIQTGELDLYLTKPVSPLLRLSLEQVNPGSVPLLVFAVCIIAYGVQTGGVQVTFAASAGYAALVLLMTILYYDMELMLRSAAFFTYSVTNLVKIENTAIELCLKIPGTAFYGVYKFVFYCVIPYGIIATIPAQMLSGMLSVRELMFAAAITGLFTVFARRLWKYGLQRYESPGN